MYSFHIQAGESSFAFGFACACMSVFGGLDEVNYLNGDYIFY